MRTAHRKAHLLPLLLLSLHSVSVCLAYSCNFDGHVKDSDSLNIATAEAQPTGQNWEPIRIVTSAKDLQVKSKYCRNQDGSIHERGTKDAGSDCTDTFATLSADKNTIVEGILARAIALHTDRLLVQRTTGPLKIPDLSKYESCKYFNIPAEHHTTGVTNADMVLYVGYVPDMGDDSPSVGLTCAKSASGRPIAGALMLGEENNEVSRHTVRFAAHQIAHALGFSYGGMKSRNMIMDKSVRGKPNSVAVLKSDKTKEMTRAHYGCPTAEDMELEDGKKNDKKTLSHWERRNAKDELMASPFGPSGTSFMGFYSNLTMAAFEDMGFYKANFEMAEHMEYGHKAGCDFLAGKCMDKGATKWPKMFCDDPPLNKGSYFCTTDRMGLGTCPLKKDFNPPLPEYFQYFKSDKKGGLDVFLTDYCPVVEPLTNKGCANIIGHGEMPGSIFGKNSMCLDGDALHAKVASGSYSVAAVCAEISCEGGSVKVKYDGDKNNKWHDCPEGQSLTPSLTSESFVSGTIKCPKYNEVCTIAPDGSTLVPKVIFEPPTTASPTASPPASPSASPTASPSASPPASLPALPTSSPTVLPTALPTVLPTALPTASVEPTGDPNDPMSDEESEDSSSVTFGFIPSVAFLVLSFAGCLIA